MSTECTANPLAISELLLAGDVILNLSSRDLNVLPGVPYLTVVDGQLTGTLQPSRVNWADSLAATAGKLLAMLESGRIVLVCGSMCTRGPAAQSDLAAADVCSLLVRLSEECDASAFMDVEDAEAVSERLRQLGYL